MSAYPPNSVAPVGPLEYSELSPHGRPGILTAIGVLSIIVACISGLVSLWGTMMAFGLMMMAGRPFPVMMPPTATTGPAMVSPASTPTVTIGGVTAPLSDDEEDGLAGPQRDLVAQFLARRGALDAQRQKHLEVLLSAAGKKMFPTPQGKPLTTEAVRRDVNDFGVIPSADGSGGGTNYFVIGTGRIEVYDDHALYRPDGSGDVVSATAPADASSSSQDPTAAPSQPSSATPAVPAGPNVYYHTTVKTIGPGGIRTRTGPATTMPGFRTVPLQFPAAAAVVSMGESAASLALALLLFIAGILVLRDSAKGQAAHWWYVWIKIPLVIVAVIANAVMWSGFMNAVTTASGAGGTAPPRAAFAGVMMVWALMAGGLALAYPIGLIFALRSRTVRNYYNSVRGE